MNQINLDINKSGQIINEPVVLRVGDKDQTITVNLLKDGQPYTSFTTATFFANKPSGSIVANDPANISSGTITYTVPQALVNEFGKITNAYFLIDGKVSTESFVIAVLQGVNISDDLNDYIPGMSNLNVIYDKWKAKLQAITDELAGIDAPKEVKNVIDNELKNYTDQINELQRRITALKTQLDALVVPVNAVGTNLLINTGDNNDVGHPVKLPSVDISTKSSLSRTEEYTQLTAPPASYTEMFYRFSDPATNNGMYGLESGQTYTIQGDISVSKGTVKFRSQQQDSSGEWIGYDGGLSDSLVSDSDNFVHVSYTFTVPDSAKGLYISWQVYGYDSTTIFRFRKMKLEKGSVATDYSLNPSDIATNDSVQTAITNALSDVKTQINNSAVGTNLLLKTNVPFSMTGNNTTNQFQQMYALSRRLEKGTTVTISFDAVSTAFANFSIQNNGKDGGTFREYVKDTVDTTKKHYVVTAKLDGFSDLGVNIRLDNVPSTTTITISNMKLELGSVATDYSLNPSEILTQSDYAKIKAAIVALGGSLS